MRVSSVSVCPTCCRAWEYLRSYTKSCTCVDIIRLRCPARFLHAVQRTDLCRDGATARRPTAPRRRDGTD